MTQGAEVILASWHSPTQNPLLPELWDTGSSCKRDVPPWGEMTYHTVTYFATRTSPGVRTKLWARQPDLFLIKKVTAPTQVSLQGWQGGVASPEMPRSQSTVGRFLGIGYICVKFECTIYVRLSPQLRVMLWEKQTAGITVPEKQLGVAGHSGWLQGVFQPVCTLCVQQPPWCRAAAGTARLRPPSSASHTGSPTATAASVCCQSHSAAHSASSWCL